MTAVEVVEMTPEQARRIVARINGTTAELVDLIEQAWRGRAWVALGYASWAALCDAEIVVPKLDPQRRAEMVGALRSAGMSTGAIGSGLGVHHSTLADDLAGVGFPTPVAEAPSSAVDRPAPKVVTGTDGKTYPARRRAAAPEVDPVPPRVIASPRKPLDGTVRSSLVNQR